MKRHTDTKIWQKDWFLELSSSEKLAFIYIKDHCDSVGVWKPSIMMISFSCGKFDYDNFINIMVDMDHYEILKNGRIWIKDYIKFHYGQLNINCKPHKGYIDLAYKHGLPIEVSDPQPVKTPAKDLSFVRRAKAFYQEQVDINSTHEHIDLYKMFIGRLFGEEPYTSVLRIDKQVRLDQFLALITKAKERDQGLLAMLDSMENNVQYTRGKKSVSQTLHAWLDRRPLSKLV